MIPPLPDLLVVPLIRAALTEDLGKVGTSSSATRRQMSR